MGEAMKVQVLYFEGCPNHEPAVALARQVIADLGVDASVGVVEVKGADDAERMRFLGSPTVIVDGVDIEPCARNRTDFGFCCRTYNGKGIPPRKLFEDALHDRGPAPRKAGLWAALGAVVSAVIASACCWLPLLLLPFGLSAAGASAAFEVFRPGFLLGAAILLGSGFYLTYVRRPACATGGACTVLNPRLRRFSRAMLWLAAAVASAVAFFPNYAGILSGGTGETAAAHGSSPETLTLRIEGMTCESCSAVVRKAIKDVRGVQSVKVDYASKEAAISTEPCCPAPVEAVLRALEEAGYRAEVIGDRQPNSGQ
jgi:copper chaperone CopZ